MKKLHYVHVSVGRKLPQKWFKYMKTNI